MLQVAKEDTAKFPIFARGSAIVIFISNLINININEFRTHEIMLLFVNKISSIRVVSSAYTQENIQSRFARKRKDFIHFSTQKTTPSSAWCKSKRKKKRARFPLTVESARQLVRDIR